MHCEYARPRFRRPVGSLKAPDHGAAPLLGRRCIATRIGAAGDPLSEEYLSAIKRAGFRDVGVVSKRNDNACGREGPGLIGIAVTGTK